MTVLSVHDLNVWVERKRREPLHVVRDVSFEIEAGERYALVGESGSGKTSTLLAVLGLAPAGFRVGGISRINGVARSGSVTEGPLRPWRDFSIVFQAAMSSFSPVHTIGSQIAEPIVLHEHVSSPAARDRVRELLTSVGLRPEAALCYPHELSGGMRQRAALAMALACKPKLLVADEPTSALDVVTQDQILRLIGKLCAEFDMALLLVSHDLGACMQVCDRLGVMYGGELVESGPATALQRGSVHPYTKMLLEAIPDLDPGREPKSIPGVAPDPAEKESGCRFAPRCPSSEEICMRAAPGVRWRGPGQSVRCFEPWAAKLHEEASRTGGTK
jgi:peptide/nickel transport system ATP-binding protein